MAEEKLVLCDPLCFLLSKIGKMEPKALKNVLFEYFNPTDITAAKKLLLENITDLKLSEKMPHIAQRREGESRIRLEIDDIFELLNYLDEQKKLNCLPRYVTSNIDAMPSIRLFEGDLSFIMSRLDRIEGRLDMKFTDMAFTLAAIIDDLRVINKQGSRSTSGRVQDWPTVGAAVPNKSQAAQKQQQQQSQAENRTVQPINNPSGNATIASLIRQAKESSCRNEPNAAQKSDHLLTRHWGSDTSTPAAKSRPNLKRAQGTTSFDSDRQNDSADDQPFIDYASRHKKRRERSRQIAVNELAVKKLASNTSKSTVDLKTQHQQKPAVNTRVGPLVIGNGHVTTLSSRGSCGVKAANQLNRSTVKRSFFCIDNIDSSCEVDQIIEFVSAMSVRVVSCFPARTRRRRSDKEDEEPNRHAFRLCINSEDCHLLLNPDNWPKHVTISEWFFKANEPVQLTIRKTGNAAISSPAAAAAAVAASSTRDVINIANMSSGLNSVSVVADAVVSEQASMTSNCEAMETAKDSSVGDVDDVEDIDATILTQPLHPHQDGGD
jgi:hypothetical protein